MWAITGEKSAGTVLITVAVVDLIAAVTDGEPVSAYIRRLPKPLSVSGAVYLVYHLFAPVRWRRWDPLGVLGSGVTQASRCFRAP